MIKDVIISHGTSRIQVDDILAKGDRAVVLAPRVRSAAVEADPHRRSPFGRSKMDEPPSSGSTRAISRPKTSSGRHRSNQKVGRSLRKARRGRAPRRFETSGQDQEEAAEK